MTNRSSKLSGELTGPLEDVGVPGAHFEIISVKLGHRPSRLNKVTPGHKNEQEKEAAERATLRDTPVARPPFPNSQGEPEPGTQPDLVGKIDSNEPPGKTEPIHDRSQHPAVDSVETLNDVGYGNRVLSPREESVLDVNGRIIPSVHR